MAPLHHFSSCCCSNRKKKVLILNLLLFLLSSSSFLFSVQSDDSASPFTPRKLLDSDQPKSNFKNQTKLIKSPSSSSSKNQTKFNSPFSTTKNQTKLLKLISNSDSNKNKTKLLIKSLTKDSPQIKKLNSTSKPSNTTKSSFIQSGKSPDLSKLASPKNKTTNPISSKMQKPPIQVLKSKTTTTTTTDNKKSVSIKSQKKVQPKWIEEDEEEDDIVTGLRDLPTKFQETLIPDLKKISSTSKDYLTKANKEITRGMKPIVGKQYAASMASAISFAFIIIPLILVFLLCNRIKSYFSLQKLLIFIQAYLAIYFSILCISSLVTGLEPLRFFYSTSQSTYVCLQVLQTLAYVLYLLLLLMYLVLVFSTDTGSGSKLLGLAQTMVGYAVGLHYYMTVFHNVVLRQPPKTNWKVHGVYATCYLVICLLATAERTKKSYLEASGEENKKN